jgi:hypothetical protein
LVVGAKGGSDRVDICTLTVWLLTRLPQLGQGTDFFRGIDLRISSGFRVFAPPKGV